MLSFNYIDLGTSVEATVIYKDGTPLADKSYSAGTSHEEVTSDLQGTVYLDCIRSKRFKEFDIRTDELLAVGFTFGSKQFSMSASAQAKIMGTHQIKDNPALVYPLSWNTIDDADSYDIVDSTDLTSFYLTALGTIRAHVDSGSVLKTSVRNATTVAAIMAVVDGR